MKRMILCAMAALVAVAVSAQSRGYENGYRGNVEVEVGTLLDRYLNIGFLTSHGYGTPMVFMPVLEQESFFLRNIIHIYLFLCL